MTTLTTPPTPTTTPPRTRPALLLTAVLTGQFMALLDVSVVNVAGPTLRTDLHATGSALQLVVSGYTIAYAALIVTGARLGRTLGTRRLFLTGLAVFTAASLACGLAPGTGTLITARAIQGTGAALMVPQVLVFIQRTFDGTARARALGLYAAVIAGGAVAGQILGGLLVSADLFGWSWRPVFLVNVPVGLVLLALTPRLLPDDTPAPTTARTRLRGLDLPGLLVVSPAMLLTVVPLVLGHEHGWPLWGWLSMAAGGILFAVFARIEHTTENHGGTPLVSGRLLRTQGVTPAAVTLLLTMTAYAGFLFTLALYLQGTGPAGHDNGRGYTALHAGLVFVSGAAAFALVSLNWQKIPARFHALLPALAMPVVAAAYLALGWAQHEHANQAVVMAALAAVGIPLGAAYSPVMALGLRKVAPGDAADAGGLLATVTQFGQVLGVAVFGSLYLGQAGSGAGHAAWITALGMAAASLAATASAAVLHHGTRRA